LKYVSICIDVNKIYGEKRLLLNCKKKCLACGNGNISFENKRRGFGRDSPPDTCGT